MTEQMSQKDIYATARLAFSPRELQELPIQMHKSLITMINRAWKNSGKLPTQAQVEGFKEILGGLWHPALSALQNQSPD